MKSPFFLFSQEDVSWLLQRSKRKAIDFDCVLAILPGIDLSGLRNLPTLQNVEVFRLEEMLEKLQLTQYAISERASELSLEILKIDDKRPNFEFWGVDFRPALLNNLALALHNSIAFEMLFEMLCAEGLDSAACFMPNGKFALVERLDIRVMLRPSLTLVPHLMYLCKANEVKFKGERRSELFLAAVENAARNFLLWSYKSAILFRRSVQWWRKPKASPRNEAPERKVVLVLIRAATELTSIQPVLTQMKKEGGPNFVLLVDDLLKNPDATKAVSETTHQWLNVHQFSNPIEVIFQALRVPVILKLEKAFSRKSQIPVSRKNKSLSNFFLERKTFSSTLKTATATLSELTIFSRQISAAIQFFQPHCILTMDMVDRWAAVVGTVGAQFKVPTLILQNTALDKIRYPLPLATDHMIVANSSIRDVLIKSGANPDRLHATGLPSYAASTEMGAKRLRLLSSELACSPLVDQSFKILVATQPFVQSFDYNGQMLEDLARVIQKHKNIEIIIKPHPRELNGAYEKRCSVLVQAGYRVKIFSGTFEMALGEADLVLSRTSTAIQKALLGGVPSIAYLRDYPREIVDRLDYLSTAAVFKHETPEELGEFINIFARPRGRLEVLENFSRNRMVYLGGDVAGSVDATSAALGLIQRLVKAGGNVPI